MRDDLDDCEFIEYEFGDSKPAWYYPEEPIIKTKAQIQAANRADKARQTILKKRKEFCDEILRNAHMIQKPDPDYLRKHVNIIVDAGYRDACLNPKEFGIVLWGARYLRVGKNRKVIEGLIQLGPETDFWFSRSCIAGDFMFQQITRWMPQSYVGKARVARMMTQNELDLLNERALGSG